MTASNGSTQVDWEAVYLEYVHRIYNFFRYRLGDDLVAQDLTSQTFEKAWRSREQYRQELGTVATWLFRIARNLSVDYFRQPKPAQVPLDSVYAVAAEDSVEGEAQRRDDFARLYALLATLPAREQELVALKYGAGLTNRAIANITQLSEFNVGTILHRIVQKLRAEWEVVS
jgi:RNA polymerase sigma-70 factor (ECF subfamily)